MQDQETMGITRDRFVLLLILFAVTFSLEFSGLHRGGCAILGTNHTRFSLSWWKRSALTWNSLQLEMGKWGRNMAARGLFVSRSLFQSWNIWGILAQRGKTFSFYVIFCESEMKTRTASEYIEKVYYKFLSLFLPRSNDRSVIMYMEMYLVNVAANE